MREYDFSTGLVTRMTDTDNSVSSLTVYDVFGGPTLVKAAENKDEETHTSTEYSEVNRRVIVRSDLTAKDDGKLVSIQHYDQLGRIRLARQLEDATNPNDAYDENEGHQGADALHSLWLELLFPDLQSVIAPRSVAQPAVK